jgi:hypothetical protein
LFGQPKVNEETYAKKEKRGEEVEDEKRGVFSHF